MILTHAASRKPQEARTIRISVMAPPKFLFLLVVVVLASVFVASNAEQPPPGRTLHLPVFFRHPPDAMSLASVADDDRPPLRSPLQSGVAHDSGGYFAALGVGTPPSRALLILDTGSDFTWLQCAPCRRCHPQLTPLYDPRRSSSYAPVPFASPRCRDELQFPGRDARTGACLYALAYADGSSSRGEVAADALAFSSGVVRNVTIGCGRDNEGLLGAAAGVLGVGRGVLSFPTQLAAATNNAYARVFSYCLGDRDARAETSSSYLVFGRATEPPSAAFTPMRTSARKPSQYVVDMVGFSVDGAPVVVVAGADDLALDPATGRGGVVVDSGATVSRFSLHTYAALRDAFDARAAAAAGMRNVRENISVYDACYELLPTARVPAVAMHFAGGADVVLRRRNYLVPVESRGRTYYCFGFMGFAPNSADERNTLGNVQQQGFHIVFDEERKRIGFAPNGC
ncbi:hypothetical protein PR202_gb04953 [Eleusine coracana subsp. coracana]|uniref:Peptidase A1 domain-containing protein n=1 Tax=Eleusine coracana subsp. coracana TaxID=191504 RepID=A0AAV5E6N9_ELECO|nr:hypothetical protein PR202_gb04953 [Eleusine coracana subsp. coracana]